MKTKLVIPIIAMGAGLFAYGCKHADKAAEMPEMTVDVANPTTDSLTIRKSFPATLAAAKKVEVVARVSGFITGKHFNDGDRVRRGQTLFTIESSQYLNAVKQAEADLATAQSALEYARRNYQAMTKALESDAVSQMDVISAQNTLNQAVARESSCEASLATARTNLGYCTVTALSDGRIAQSALVVGDYVDGAAQPVKLTTIYDDSTLDAVFSVNDSRYIDILRNTASDSHAFDSIPVTFGEAVTGAYAGRIDYVAPEVDTSTGTLTLKVALDNRNGELRDGMFARVHLPMAEQPHAILIRDSAISTDQRGDYVYVVNDSDRIVYTPILTGDLYQDTLRIVTSGLSTSDRYVTKALLKVRDGMKVKCEM